MRAEVTVIQILRCHPGSCWNVRLTPAGPLEANLGSIGLLSRIVDGLTIEKTQWSFPLHRVNDDVEVITAANLAVAGITVVGNIEKLQPAWSDPALMERVVADSMMWVVIQIIESATKTILEYLEKYTDRTDPST